MPINEKGAIFPVVLIVPPFSACEIMSLSCGILKATLQQKAIGCKVYYANILFSEMIGQGLYNKILGYHANEIIGERIFAPSAYVEMKEGPIDKVGPPRYLEDYVEHLNVFYNEVRGITDRIVLHADIPKVRSQCKAFIEKVVRDMYLLKPKIIGFSSHLQQINSSVALAGALKKKLPNAIYVIGGNNCAGVMGEELASSIKVFDYVFQGEADFVFADFCENYLKKNVLPEEKVIRCLQISDMDAAPIPDHTDFFQQYDGQNKENIWLMYESSRGCWWGDKHQCRFCGFNSKDTSFRYKSPERVIAELQHLGRTYPEIHRFLANDCICPQIYFKDMFPKLSTTGFRGELYYEVKANLTHGQLLIMKKAGVTTINPGIESLSTQLLRLMNKGVDAPANVRLLRDCRELDLTASWNLLVGFPGDQESDYEEQARIVPLIQHLFPPALIPYTVQRFSPYFEDSETYGLTNIKPFKAYEYAFPRFVDTGRLAYYFNAEFPSSSRERPGILDSLIQELIRWRKKWQNNTPPGLWIKRLASDQWQVEDTRACSTQSVVMLDTEEHSILMKCRIPKFRDSVELSEKGVRLLDLGYLLEVDNKLLSIVCDSSITS